MLPDVSNVFSSVRTEWHEEVTVGAQFLNGQPCVSFTVKGPHGPERLQACIDLGQAEYIRNGLTKIIEKFKEEGFNV